MASIFNCRFPDIEEIGEVLVPNLAREFGSCPLVAEVDLLSLGSGGLKFTRHHASPQEAAELRKTFRERQICLAVRGM